MSGHALRVVGAAVAFATAATVSAPSSAKTTRDAAARSPFRVTLDGVVRHSWAQRATERRSGCRVDVTGGGSREVSFRNPRAVRRALPRGGADPRLRGFTFRLAVSGTMWRGFEPTYFQPRECEAREIVPGLSHGDPPPPTRRRFASATARFAAAGRAVVAALLAHPSLPRTIEVCGSAKVAAPGLEIARGRVVQRTLRQGRLERLVIRGRRLLTRQVEVPGLDSCTVQTHVEWTLTLARVRPRR